MAEERGPTVYSIAAHRGFADALVAGLTPRYSEPDVGLARLTLLLPSARARQVVTEAFVRLGHDADGPGQGAGTLLPRMVVVGELDLDERLGSLLDPLGAEDIPPAVSTTRRWLELADLIAAEMGDNAPTGAARWRLAREYAQTMDRLLIEEIGPEELVGQSVLDILGNLSGHWLRSLRNFVGVQDRWLARLAEIGAVDAAQRRNLLFDRAAKRWRADPPDRPLVAAGITSGALALARMLRAVADMPRGAVVLPDLDLAMPEEVWEELGRAGSRSAGERTGEADDAFGSRDSAAHPQYHLKLLLNRMGIARGEVRPWHRRGEGAGPPERSYAISNLFLPPQASRGWAELPANRRRLSGVKLMTSANPQDEAQAIALLIREAVETPAKRVALITPDRALAQRVVQQLRRWNIEADDSAGRPLSRTPAGRAFLLLCDVIAQRAAPVPLLAFLGHPLVCAIGDEERTRWLGHLRTLDAALRGPRPAAGLAPLGAIVRELAAKRDEPDLVRWWEALCEVLDPLLSAAGDAPEPLADWLDRLIDAAQRLCGDRVWAREDGRALSTFLEDLRLHARECGACLPPRELAVGLRDQAECVAVRPPYRGHSRVAIYGLIESRLTRADLVICAGLNEGTWPGQGSADPLLAPAVMRVLGVPGTEYRIGLSAHDLAGALGAPEVVLSRARRDEGGPAVPSRFVLRVEALLGELAGEHRNEDAVQMGQALDLPDRPVPVYPRPKPRPTAAQRRVAISATAIDRLRGDPYQFYANVILKLAHMDAVDAEPSPAWQGSLAHRVLELWHERRESDRATKIEPIAREVLEDMGAHPLTRELWRPRLVSALRWIEDCMDADPARRTIAVEASGAIKVDGVKVHGRADRVDRLADGRLGIVDYKTGSPPSTAAVEAGFALQLGVLGLIARGGGFERIEGEPGAFEYWSLARSKDRKNPHGFGYVQTPLKVSGKKTGIDPDDFLPMTEGYLRDAITRFITGDEPFTARLVPDFPGYADYDQLMRLDEWQIRGEGSEAVIDAQAGEQA